jgi:hypothetical protein
MVAGCHLGPRVLNAVGRDPFAVQGNEKIRRTCSIGWAAFPWFVAQPGAVDYREALRLADSALYQAKKEERNRAIGMLPLSEECPTVLGCPMRSEDEKFSGRLEARTVLTPGPLSTGNENRQEAPANAKVAVAAQEA